MTVYADVSFFINFMFDAELLILLCKVFFKKINIMRIFFSSILGGLTGVFAFIPYLEIISRAPARFIIPVFMIYIAIKPVNIKSFSNYYISYLCISFIMSGAVHFFDLNAFSGLLIPVPIYLAICLLRKNIKKRKGKVVLEYKDRKIDVEGFFDSGNMLFSGSMPVILGNNKVFESLLDCRIENENIQSLSKKFEMRIVPFMALGKAGTVMGIRLNRIWVDGKEYIDVVLAYAGNKFCDDLILNSIML